MNLFRKKKEPARPPQKPTSVFSTHAPLPDISRDLMVENFIGAHYQVPIEKVKIAGDKKMALDSVAMDGIKQSFNQFYWQGLPEAVLGFYATQSFIGWQICAMLAQNWLIDKACTVPARDAVRNGFDISIPDTEKVPDDFIVEIKKRNKEMKINDSMVELVRFSRVFGIRVALFKIDTGNPIADKEFYSKPFNIDGVKKNSYKGIVQIDPYWITPELSQKASSQPGTLDFYVPTYWTISGIGKVHHSHLHIVITSEVADVLKPTYFFGGIPLPQKIAERVYAAERTANEAPLLALTKRTTTIHTDLAMAEANKESFIQRIQKWAAMRDNYGIKVVGLEDVVEQFDTSLTDLDAIIMTQYQLVAAIAEMPATKLLGTTPKGFNATGEYDEASYHEMLESLQTHDLTPFLNKHHMLLMKSEFPDKNFTLEVSWKPVNSPTAAESAEIRNKDSQTDTGYVNAGVLLPEEVRDRLRNDPDSGFANITDIGNISELTDDDPEDDKGDNNAE